MNKKIVMRAKKILQQVFHKLGIEEGRDLVVNDERFYSRVIRDHSIGMGEAYMDGWWDSEDITKLFKKILRGLPEMKVHFQMNFQIIAYQLLSYLFNRQNRNQALKNVQSHYDIGNELFELMLDKNMVYTCAYFHNPSWNLEEAQLAKIDLVYQKLKIPKRKKTRKRLKILDIGCGWGYSLIHGAKYYGTEGVGLTLSEEQVEFGKKKALRLPVEIRLQDYRDLPEDKKFDAIFSLGMFEHVGQSNYREFMKIVARHLKPNGLFLLHTIGCEEPGPVDPWMSKYIFPNATIPSKSQIHKATSGLFFEQDFHNFGFYYGRTAQEWFKRFKNNWLLLQSVRPAFYTNRFYRMWKYYLLSSAASFYEGKNQLWQIVYSANPLNEFYEAARSVEKREEKNWTIPTYHGIDQ